MVLKWCRRHTAISNYLCSNTLADETLCSRIEQQSEIGMTMQVNEARRNAHSTSIYRSLSRSCFEFSDLHYSSFVYSEIGTQRRNSTPIDDLPILYQQIEQ